MGKKSRRRRTAQKNASPQKQQAQRELNDETNENWSRSQKERDQTESSNAETNEELNQEPLEGIHELDEPEAVFKWVAKTNFTAKCFAKHLPHTAKALQDGNVTPEDVVRHLERSYFSTTFLAEIDPIEGLAHVCAMSALPAMFFQSDRHRDDIVACFRKDLLHELSHADPGPCHGKALVKNSVDDICEKWAARLDLELFGGKKGTFLKRCPLYGITPEEYDHEDSPMCEYVKMRDLAAVRQESLFTVAEHVAKGLHVVSRTCWECRNVCQDLKSCANCDLAQYCSEECQRRAWKNRHKHNCKLLGRKYAAVEDALKAIEEYHSLGNENGFAKHDFRLNHVLDLLTFDSAIRKIDSGRKEDEIPSMRLYYENLEEIVLGKTWFFPDASEERYLEARLESSLEEVYFRILRVALCFDYKENKLFESIQTWCEKSVGGIGMPASTFIDLFSKYSSNTKDEADKSRDRREYKRSILQFFMEQYHADGQHDEEGSFDFGE